MGKKQSFAIFDPRNELVTNIPVVRLNKVLLPDSQNALLKDGKVIRRKMREADMLNGIDVGSSAIDRNSAFNQGNTLVNKSNPANASGIITSVEIWANTDLTGCIVATFSASGNNLTAHDSYAIGNVTAGSKQTFNVSLDINLGEYIGIFIATGYIELSEDSGSGGDGVWYHLGNMTGTPSHLFSFGVTYYAISLYGTKTESKSPTPDGNPIIHYHKFIKRSTGTQYLLAFTKAHIYHWNTATSAFDLKFTCSADCTSWETKSYNDKVIATNGVDKVLAWDTTGNFVPLDTASGIQYDTGKYLTKCKHLTTYESYLILGYTYEDTKWYPQRMRWNAIGNEMLWIPTGFAAGAGSTEVGKADFIIGFGMYRGYMIVFKQESHFKYWLVASSYTFNGANISMTIGAKCSGGIVNDNKGRLYWYASDGTIKEMSVGTISQPIQTEIIDKIYQSSVDLIKSKFIDETEETWFSIPYENTLNNLVITLKEDEQGNRIWGQVDLAIPAFGDYRES